MTTQTQSIPGYVAGTWAIDTVHSDIAFAVRHLGVGKARGRFDEFEGTIVLAENPLESSVNATIQTTSVSSKNTMRDDHIKNADFLDVENHPTMTFVSTGVRAVDAENYLIDGDLTLKGKTNPVVLQLELGGFGTAMSGGPLAGFSASTVISRSDFGVTGGPAGAAVGEKITISLDIEATLA